MSWNASLIDGPLDIPAPGYHLNVAPSCMTSALGAFEVKPAPNTPFRLFSGAPTHFLCFASEAEARGALGAYWRDPTAEDDL